MFSVMPWTKPVIGTREVFPNRLAEFAPIFNRLFANWPIPFEGWTFPETYRGIKFEETDKEYMFFVEAPGFEIKDFEINVVGNLLNIKVEHLEKEPNVEKKEFAYYYNEKTLDRSITLPVGVEVEKIYAFYKNGILELHLPKSVEVKPRRVMVKG